MGRAEAKGRALPLSYFDSLSIDFDIQERRLLVSGAEKRQK
jgi:hypothetical protein